MNDKSCQDQTTNSSKSITNKNNSVSFPLGTQIDRLYQTNRQHPVAENNRDAVFVLDRDGYYVTIAPINQPHLYKPSEELLSKTLYQVFEQSIANSFLNLI